MIKVTLTNPLRQQLSAGGVDPDQLCSDFATWKTGGDDDSYLFGKHSVATRGQHLCHVHLVPLNEPATLSRWNTAWRRRSKRTSDRCLFYADGGRAYGFLLIAVIGDPGAHAVWQESRRAEVAFLEKIAADFYYTGRFP
jgi:hypothetical protein